MSQQQPSFFKALALRTLGPAVIGRFDYAFRPSLRRKWGGPMNGQSGRQCMTGEIIAAVNATAIVETGTYRGGTTEFLAQYGLPVYTVEANPQYHAYSVLRLRRSRGRVQLSLGDSRPFLRRLAQEASMPKDSVFFYLDAHWEADLPLAEEIAIIFGAWTRAVIMVDDFAVPGDSGYRYDDYGPGRALDATYLTAMKRDDLSMFYPALPATQETGLKRGSVVLCNDPQTRERLASLQSLRAA